MSDQLGFFDAPEPPKKPAKPAAKLTPLPQPPPPTDPPPAPYNGPIRRYTIHKEANETTIWNDTCP